ncbi:MAG: GntR family transcriptional regulator, partial [Burkholderiaceae bacterium]|nr:GntR family transcriptional regulator [Burkholderiaceae bacterium]
MERADGATVWSQIEQQLAERIASGTLRNGSQLPAEHALAEEFGVNRHTVRQAIASLSA